jgi:hypothetical protein
MSDLPDGSNFFACLTTRASLAAVAGLYRVAGWEVMWGRSEVEVRNEIAELIIEGKPILLHGPVADPVANIDRLTQPLRDGRIGYQCECYGEGRALLLERRWKPPPWWSFLKRR